MSQGVKDLIAAISTGDAQAIDSVFNAEMANRIGTRLEDMRANVAKNMFATEQAVEESVEEDEEPIFESIAEEEAATLIQGLTEEEFNEPLSEDDEIGLTEKYEGFAKLKGELARKPGVKNPGAVAAAIGRKKYGKEKFQKMAAAGKKAKSESWK